MFSLYASCMYCGVNVYEFCISMRVGNEGKEATLRGGFALLSSICHHC